ncbi:MAG: histidinol-phosphate transaminase [Pontibacterium sp.]
MSKFWSPAVNDLSPYVPGEQPKTQGITKLNTNENPYPPSPAVEAAVNSFDQARLRLYPDPESSQLTQALAEHFDLATEQVFVGNGSDEVLALAFMAFFRQSDAILFPEITYSFYDVYCGLYNIDYKKVPLTDTFAIDPADYQQTNGGIILANPNAPTGKALPLSDIEALLKGNPERVVIIDEAYVDFGAESAATLVNTYDNLLVIQTFSKSRSLAGIRVGYALGHPALIDGLSRVKNSFNSYPLDMFAQTCAVASLGDQAYFKEKVQAIIDTREWTHNALTELGFKCIESKANFIFCEHRFLEGAEVMGYLRSKNLLVRHFSKPGIDNFLRITIGTPAEMALLVNTLKAHPDLA